MSSYQEEKLQLQMAELLIAMEVHCKVSTQQSKPGCVYQAVKHSYPIVMLYKISDMFICYSLGKLLFSRLCSASYGS